MGVEEKLKVMGLELPPPATPVANCVPDFLDHPQVVNGASDLLVEVFGDRGRRACSAVGMPALPIDIAVEIEMIAEVED